jgi:retron-type reverse transcriptase
LGNLSAPKTVQKLQKALQAKAKAEAGYRFYALYDKISREDVLAHAFAQCRSNKGAPGVDGRDFADIEAYGVERWLGELALALREESYRPDPIRRVFIRKANGKLRPLAAATRKSSMPTSRTTSGVFPIPSYCSRWRAGSLIGACCI